MNVSALGRIQEGRRFSIKSNGTYTSYDLRLLDSYDRTVYGSMLVHSTYLLVVQVS